MEVFFKNISSEEAPTEQLVEDVLMLVDEAEDLVKKTRAGISPGDQEELKTALERLKNRCQRIKEHAFAGARRTDRLIRKYPYPSVLVAFGVGILVGALVNRGGEDD